MKTYLIIGVIGCILNLACTIMLVKWRTKATWSDTMLYDWHEVDWGRIGYGILIWIVLWPLAVLVNIIIILLFDYITITTEEL